jgi:chromosome partitioning protein
MLEMASQTFDWIQARWKRLSNFWKFIAVITVLITLGVAVDSLPGFSQLQAWFTQANPRAQTAILGLIFMTCVVLAIFAYERSRKADQLKEQLKTAQSAADGFKNDATNLQARWDRLLDVESKEQLWQRPYKVAPPKSVLPGQRKTRFLTVLNLKGGVGKTTLTSNLAATLSLDHTKRILLVDIDFQGTLGDATVDPKYVTLQREKADTADRLLTPASVVSVLPKLLVPMNGVSGSKVVLANDTLERLDYSLQARFFVDPNEEVRYFFVPHFHTDFVLDQFDLVIFDCPPRLTTSTINALTCSDLVIIPTKLDVGSVNAVPRTIDWLQTLNGITQARLLGVIATQTAIRMGKLTKDDKNNYDYLKAAVAQHSPGQDLVFKTTASSSTKAANTSAGLAAAVNEESRELYRPIANELKERLRACANSRFLRIMRYEDATL